MTEKVTNWRVWDDVSIVFRESPLKVYILLKEECVQRARRQILKTKLRPGDVAKTREDTTVFDHLVHSDLSETKFRNGGFVRLAQVLFLPFPRALENCV